MDIIKKIAYLILILVINLPKVVSAQLGGQNEYNAGPGTLGEYDPNLVDSVQTHLRNQYTNMEGMNLSRLSLNNVISNILLYILGIIGVLAVVCLVIAGIMYITAAGDEDRVEKAKKMLTYAAIGLAVALLGLVIVIAVDTIIG